MDYGRIAFVAQFADQQKSPLATGQSIFSNEAFSETCRQFHVIHWEARLSRQLEFFDDLAGLLGLAYLSISVSQGNAGHLKAGEYRPYEIVRVHRGDSMPLPSFDASSS